MKYLPFQMRNFIQELLGYSSRLMRDSTTPPTPLIKKENLVLALVICLKIELGNSFHKKNYSSYFCYSSKGGKAHTSILKNGQK